VTKVTKVFKEM
jgi:hypothetical protein